MRKTIGFAITGIALLILTAGCGTSRESNLAGQTILPEPVKAPPVRKVPVTAGGSELLASGPIPEISTGPQQDGALGGDEHADVVAPLQLAKVDPQAATRRLDEREQGRAVELKDIYFDFDSWMITTDAREALVSDAQWLRTHPDQIVTIEGHCDERGTSAYNLVLGEKRARAVRKYLMDLGIMPDILRVVSYGKERPVCTERDEACYRQNRRGHVVAETQ